MLEETRNQTSEEKAQIELRLQEIAQEREAIEAWRGELAGWRAQLDKGLVEVTVEGTEPDGDSDPPENGLEFQDVYNRFNEYPVLTGWGEDA